MTNVTMQSPSGEGIPTGNVLWVEASSSCAMVQACNMRIAHSGVDAIRIDADNVMFYGENISLENWYGNEGFYISQSSSSLAFLGVGFACTPGGRPCAPRSQFRPALTQSPRELLHCFESTGQHFDLGGQPGQGTAQDLGHLVGRIALHAQHPVELNKVRTQPLHLDARGRRCRPAGRRYRPAGWPSPILWRCGPPSPPP